MDLQSGKQWVTSFVAFQRFKDQNYRNENAILFEELKVVLELIL